jgi:hypothetical protein
MVTRRFPGASLTQIALSRFCGERVLRLSVFVTAFTLIAANSSAAIAQSSSAAAVGATEAAKSATSNIQTISIVDPAAPLHRFDLTLNRAATQKPIIGAPTGAQCTGASAAAADVARAPINSAGSLAPSSSTIIQLPIERVDSGYSNAVRSATLNATVPQSCAMLNH